MSKRDERRRAQEAELAAQIAMSQARPNEPEHGVADADACPGYLGRAHDYTMNGRDGIKRCWYCGRRRPAKG